MSDRYIAVRVEGHVEVHARAVAGGNYITLCGLDGDDPGTQQEPAKLSLSAKIDCEFCQQLILAARRYSKKDFAL
jgi:hypothetical protein